MAETLSYPPTMTIEPATGPIVATARPPGSKSISNRALILAALSSVSRPQCLTGCLRSEDTEVMIDALRKLGYSVDTHWDSSEQRVTVFRGDKPLAPAQSVELFVANSGTTMRFLTALVSLGHGRYRLDGVARMRERPIGDLLSALEQLGIEARSEYNNGCPPVWIQGGAWRGRAHLLSEEMCRASSSAGCSWPPLSRRAAPPSRCRGLPCRNPTSR